MYTVGQIVCTKVIDKPMNEANSSSYEPLELSLSPTEIQCELYHNKIQNGLVIIAAVEMIEDYGYIMETGIKNLVAFLPKENVKSDLAIGEVLACTVYETTRNSNISSTIKLTTLKNKRNAINMEQIEDINLDTILPTTTLKFQVSNLVRNGLQGTVCNGQFTALVNEYQLQKVLSKAVDYPIGNVYDARVLYTMPLTKNIFVSLNYEKIIISNEDLLPIGMIIETAQVIKNTPKGIVFNINSTAKGLITSKVLRDNYKSENYDKSLLNSKYAVNSQHRLRILSYEIFERIYICTDNEKQLNEKYFNVENLRCGQTIEGEIKMKTQENGYGVMVGNIKAYIKPYDCATIRNMKFGTKIKTKIVQINREKNMIWLTNRPEYLSNRAKLLSNYKNAVVGRKFTGLVIKEMDDFFLIRFFNQIKGILLKKVNKNNKDFLALREGKIQDFIITVVNGDRITLALPENTFDEDLGKIVDGKIISVYPTGVEISYTDENVKTTGTIPINYLSYSLELCPVIHKLLKEGETMKVTNIMSSIFSKRDVEYYQTNPRIDINDVKAGDILRCFVKTFNSETGDIEILLPLKNLTKTIKLKIKSQLLYKKKDLTDYSHLNIQPDQLLFLYVEGILDDPLSNTPKLFVSLRLTDVWYGDANVPIELLMNYLNDIDEIHQRMKNNEKPLGNLKVGQRIYAKMVKTIENKIIFEMDNGVSCIANYNPEYNKFDKKKLVVGSKIKATIIWLDFVQQVVYITFDPKEMINITVDQLIDIDLLKPEMNQKFHYVNVLLQTSDIVVAQLQKVKKSPLVYLPTHLHYNDLESPFSGKDAFKTLMRTRVYLRKVHNDRLLGIQVHTERVCEHFSRNIMLNSEKRSLFIDRKLEAIKLNKGVKSDDIKKAESKIKQIDSKLAKLLNKPENENVNEGDEDGDDIDINEEDDDDEVEVSSDDSDEANTEEDDSDNEEEDGEDDEQENGNSEDDSKEEDEISSNEEEELSPKKQHLKRKVPKAVNAVQELDSDDEMEVDGPEVMATTKRIKLQRQKTPTNLKIPQLDGLMEDYKNEQIKNMKSNNSSLKYKKFKCKKKKNYVTAPSTATDSTASKCNVGINDKFIKSLKDYLNNEKDSNKKNNKLVKEIKISAAKRENLMNIKTPIEKKESIIPAAVLEKTKKIQIKVKPIVNSNIPVEVKLPGAEDFWDEKLDEIEKDSSLPKSNSIYDLKKLQEQQDQQQNPKKRKLNASERFEAVKAEEIRIRKIENELADPMLQPHTPDHFERLLLQSRNSSLIWIKYMAFHMESAELDKARTVARKALRTINYREEQELLNVWLALLNLEIRYGTAESYENIFQEAIQLNDPFKIYAQVVEILIDCKKNNELNEILTTMLKKFKSNPEMWIIVARAYYEIGMNEKPKQLLQRALASLPERER